MRSLIAFLAAVIIGVTASGCQQQPPSAAAIPPPTMTVAKPVQMKIVEWDAYTGRMEPVDFVEVRARVSGYLQSIHFQEGQVVDEDDLLFVIDPRPFEAELSRAKAAVRQAESLSQEAQANRLVAQAEKLQADALLRLADSRLARIRRLAESNATTQEELDQRLAELLQAQANVEAAEAQIRVAEAAITTAEAATESAKAERETAELNLAYTRVHAPVRGRISQRYVTEGNLVGGGTPTSTLLTTITSVSPIYCIFNANEQDVLKYTRLALAGQRASSRVAKNPAYLGIVDETGFPHQGHMDFVDNRFDAATASLTARAVFPNDQQILVPGMFAKIRIPGSSAYQAVLIPDSAIGTDQASQYVFIVADGVLERCPVTTGPIVHGLRVIREGLTGDEELVIEGLIRARPGLEVTTKKGTIEVLDDGLPDDYEPLPPEQWISTQREAAAPTPPVAKQPELDQGDGPP